MASSRVLFLGVEHDPCCVIERGVIPAITEGEVLVKVRLATVCGSDLHTLNGKRKVATPCVLGHEGVAEVVEDRRNSSAGRLSPGDRVTVAMAIFCGKCDTCKLGLVQKCDHRFIYSFADIKNGTGFNGFYATHMVLRKGSHIVKIPDHVSDRMAAPVNCALATMVNAVHAIEESKHNNIAVVQGAGLLGLYGTALLKECGYRKVYCTDISEDRLKLVTHFGGIPYSANSGAPPVLKANSVDVVIEVCGSSEVVPEGIRLLRPGGTYVFVGMVHPMSKLSDVTGWDIIGKCLSIKGVHNYGPKHLDEAVDFVAKTAGKYPYEILVSPDVYSLENFLAAVEMSKQRKYARVAVSAQQHSRSSL
ncbi:uncharacterized protein LOC106165699 isoform X1 [Lingula anatina]|uniref:alcohol dehydrogenase n=2 Tax=Lingula anatina TaxID=7574 RepID=A0A1S3IMJ6_LINAN|nr:uncharacterized protein LOC106165699 isoform X1 [Lingula anatina]|eukprot:XP_013399460.1 uncharacterized protein LOC106165699 isoform X1 [Lingula anatina]